MKAIIDVLFLCIIFDTKEKVNRVSEIIWITLSNQAFSTYREYKERKLGYRKKKQKYKLMSEKSSIMFITFWKKTIDITLELFFFIITIHTQIHT